MLVWDLSLRDLDMRKRKKRKCLSAREVRPETGINSKEGAPGCGSREKGCPVPWGHCLGGGAVRTGRWLGPRWRLLGGRWSACWKARSGMVQRWRAEGQQAKEQREGAPGSDTGSDWMKKGAERILDPSHLDTNYQVTFPGITTWWDYLCGFQT